MIVPHEDRTTSWRPFIYDDRPGIEAVRIWIRKTPFGFFQRHEWRRPDGTSTCEAWIASGGREWPPTATETPAAEDDGADLVAALAMIADGHNDARGLARATLAAFQQAVTRC